MSKCIAAHTNLGATFPGYINFTREDDGTISVHVRGNPQTLSGSYLCGYAADRGKPGRCTPGDMFCNNYCNLAPGKGPMQARPLPCTSIVREGATVKLTLTEAEFMALLEAAFDERLASAR